MSVIKAMTCTQCGGLVNENTLTCSSCGTRFAIKDGWHTTPEYARPIQIEEIRRDQRRLTICKKLPVYMFDKAENSSKLCEFAIKEMAQQMAESLVPYMQMISEFDPKTMTYNFYSRVDVLCPDERINSYKNAFEDIIRG